MMDKKFHRKNIFFDNTEKRDAFVKKYEHLFSNGGNRTNRMWIPENYNDHHHDERYGNDYYPLLIVCDMGTWNYILAYESFKRKHIIIKTSLGKSLTKSVNLHMGTVE